MKKFALALLPVAAFSSVPAFAAGGATGPDYSSLTSAISFDSTIAAILSVGALAIALTLAVVGVRKVIRMVRGA